MADEQVADVRESSSATGGNFSRSEQTIKALQRIMDTAGVTETESLIGEQQLEIVFSYLGEDVLAAVRPSG
jgi:hypothetical protein